MFTLLTKVEIPLGSVTYSLYENIPLPVAATKPLSCESRDPKGLYESARSAATNVMTGHSDPCERPLPPDLILIPSMGTPDQMAQAVIDAINAFLQ
jgi:adenylylsulfate kinase-like enzyme